MTVREVFIKYSKLVPFPWTPAKIRKAGYNTTQFLLEFGRELDKCTDGNEASTRELIKLLGDLNVFC